jgi:hypothetical protein
MTPARFLTVDGQPHALDRVEVANTQRLRLVFSEPAPALQDRVLYILTDGASREPVRVGSGAAGGRELIVVRVY